MDVSPILAHLGFSELSGMQQECIGAILNTKGDIVILSPTGTGKTLAYLIPLVQLVNSGEDAPLQAVVIVPGRELARQSADVLQRMGTPLRSMAVHGGESTMDEHRRLRRLRPQILFATPGRLLDHLMKGNIEPTDVSFLVIDEYDKCLQMGFEDEMRRIASLFPAVRRRFFLSATPSDFPLASSSRVLNFLKSKADYSLSIVRSTEKDKLSVLDALLRRLGRQRSIVFTNYRDSADRIASFLNTLGYGVALYHGGFDQQRREDELLLFANGSANIMVATDLGSRGLDIAHVDNIIHYQPAPDHVSFVHRIGRAARWHSKGRSIVILAPDEHIPDEQVMELMLITDEDAKRPVPRPDMISLYVGKGRGDDVSRRDILGFLCKSCGAKADDVGRIDMRDRYAYVAVAAGQAESIIRHSKDKKLKGMKTVVEFAERLKHK